MIVRFRITNEKHKTLYLGWVDARAGSNRRYRQKGYLTWPKRAVKRRQDGIGVRNTRSDRHAPGLALLSTKKKKLARTPVCCLFEATAIACGLWLVVWRTRSADGHSTLSHSSQSRPNGLSALAESVNEAKLSASDRGDNRPADISIYGQLGVALERARREMSLRDRPHGYCRRCRFWGTSTIALAADKVVL